MKRKLLTLYVILMMIQQHAFSWALPLACCSPLDDTIWAFNDSCHQATPFCADSIYTYGFHDNELVYAECHPYGPPPDSCVLDLSCEGTPNNAIYHNYSPKWFVIKVDSGGWIQIMASATERHIDPQWNVTTMFYPRLYYHLWGPYDEPNPPCVVGLTLEKKIACHDSPLSPYFPAIDTITFYGETGKFYYLVVFHHPVNGADTSYHYYWQGNAGQPEAAQLSCDGVTSCAIYHISTQVGPCNPTTNTFTLSGTVYFYNAPSSGQLVIYDNNTGYGTVFYSPFVSPLQFSITGIPCDNTMHTLFASFWNEPNCTYSTSFLSPVLCPDATISGGGQACAGDSVMIQIMVSSFVQTPVTFTLARNGLVFDTITSSSFPVITWVNQAGAYTIHTVFNTLCAGTPSGQALVSIYPLPQPYLGNDIFACECKPVILDAGPGYAFYLWSTDEISQSIQVVSPGLYQVVVIDNHGCKGSDEIQVNFVPALQPLLIKHN